MVLFIGQSYAEVPENRHTVSLDIAYMTHITSGASIRVPGAIIDSGRTGLTGKVGYNHFFNERLALHVSCGIWQTEVRFTPYSFETSTVAPVLLGVKYYPLKFTHESSVKPFMLGGAGIVLGAASGVRTLSSASHTESAALAYLGAGSDFVLGSLVKLTTGLGYHLTTDFSESIGGKKNYSGPEFSFGVGFMF
jgi:hypothetical protein